MNTEDKDRVLKLSAETNVKLGATLSEVSKELEAAKQRIAELREIHMRDYARVVQEHEQCKRFADSLVTEKEALEKNLKDMTEQKDCWVFNANALQKGYNELEKKLAGVTVERDLYANEAKRCWDLMPELANSDADYELHEAVRTLTEREAAARQTGRDAGGLCSDYVLPQPKPAP